MNNLLYGQNFVPKKPGWNDLHYNLAKIVLLSQTQHRRLNSGFSQCLSYNFAVRSVTFKVGRCVDQGAVEKCSLNLITMVQNLTIFTFKIG